MLIISESDQKTVDKIMDQYDLPSHHDIPLLIPRAYDLAAREITINEIYSLPDKTKVMLRGSLVNFRIKERGKISIIYADLLDYAGRKQICQWISSGRGAYGKMKALESELLGKETQIVASVYSYTSGNNRMVFLKEPKCDIIKRTYDKTKIPVPIYQLKGTTKIYEIRKAIELTIKHASENKYSLPKNIEQSLGLMPLQDALSVIHGFEPISNEDFKDFEFNNSVYHQRVRMERIFRVLKKLKNDRSSGKSPIIIYDKEKMRELEKSLPFTLTVDQKKALGKIFKIFKRGEFKTSLLQGDVGSGKTATAIFASFSILEEGYQVAVLAPSAVLATQLFEEYKELLKPYDIKVHLLAGKTTKKTRTAIEKSLKKDEKVVVIGTTAVNNLSFSKLGLVIVDEEQKFGVEAKRALLKNKNNLPYVIYMSATPLPRSLQSSIYGNYEVIKIEAKPQGRLPVKSKIIEDQNSAWKLLEFIKKEAEEKRVSLIIAPSISSGEMASVEKIEGICRQHFGENFFKTIHGQMKEKEIEKNIKDFRAGDFPLMIATSMVEAGFSHPDLSTVTIVGPDRFGMAQLHQMRGRAGRRSGLQGYCALWHLDFSLSPGARERLEYFTAHYDGFDLANKDMKTRGSGDLIGTSQSGGEINFIEYAEEVELLKSYVDII